MRDSITLGELTDFMTEETERKLKERRKMHRNDKILIVVMIAACILAGAFAVNSMRWRIKLASARAALVETQHELDDLKHDAVIRGYAERKPDGTGFEWRRK